MGYSKCLEKAGCNVIAFEQFGSYQGTWLAFVEYKGEKGIVEGYYGSCSGCDAFEAEFGYSEQPEINDGKFYKGAYWDDDNECTEEEYNEAVEAYNKRLYDFGVSLIGGSLTNKEYYERKLAKVEEDDYGDEKEECEWAIKQDW